MPAPSLETPIGDGKRKRVVVAMSGGVDSSVVAGLLAQSGHDVIGITLQLYDHGEAVGRKGSCCAGQDVEDARRVAQKLGIPHYVLDYEKRFSDAVMKSFAESYIAGETPIPCVTCNQKIKFNDLLDTARDLGADLLATGHYVQRGQGRDGPALFRAADTDRDQSYFLFATTREQLASLWFPLGGMVKNDVRAIAHDLGLLVADKSDSQDICFVPKGRYSDVIEKLKPGALHAGDIVHIDGRRLGRHEGIVNYTIGQRRGLKIASAEPLYVLSLNAKRNEVVVGPRAFLHTRTLILRNVNWLGDGTLDEAVSGQGAEVYARIRSSQAPQPATVSKGADGAVKVTLRDGEHGAAAGQACVLYADGSTEARVLGGGWIAEAVKADNMDWLESSA
ncbi:MULTISPECIES: tRNA 2-thiouridine(34) synthase MnmA [Hyphomicrobium]|uniref:tRNA 2-thiouridine(34) synthase MnmA n=1 Tax=Hyphomicrobium TaxID=81 RepID=UPI0003674400|nr:MULTISPECIES: tRNA 2-thiouridine(34) synthase MnmA [Hyphomicrobium]WBT40006.1 tRNA 2-thiouridine(34) synthase MnmA [Hyphomicrobium sp. DMF-1]HML44723.1 tRNA 2-thiouridine(34) synthase MnmA [Hyphomicrobium zavarzinii]